MNKQELIDLIQRTANEHSMDLARVDWIDVCEELESFFSSAAGASRDDQAREEPEV